jgi:S-adenosylmethionine:tRNA ribosyltransferase-isomerase
MKTEDYNYYLPEELIAQTPTEPRDHSRMLVYHYVSKRIEHRHFYDLPEYIKPADVLVVNQTKVLPARLYGIKDESGIPVELLLLKRIDKDRWETLVRPGRRLKPGATVTFGAGRLKAEIEKSTPSGERIVRFIYDGVFEAVLDELGEMPLPPYIHEKLTDKNRYQTVYAKEEGSAAAPTAGLHFTNELMDRIREGGNDIVPITLHVGLGTFRPVSEANLEDHVMHTEWYHVTEDASERINAARKNGGRIICVGTTSVRTLETLAREDGTVPPGSGDTSIFIYPGIRLKATDCLITNFHLPESTLLMLVSALIGREEALSVYKTAVEEKYRFFSFGDACLFLND